MGDGRSFFGYCNGFGGILHDRDSLDMYSAGISAVSGWGCTLCIDWLGWWAGLVTGYGVLGRYPREGVESEFWVGWGAPEWIRWADQGRENSPRDADVGVRRTYCHG